MQLLTFDHAVVRAGNVDEAVRWYQEVLGLTDAGNNGEVRYLRCGGDQHFDLGVTSGGSGLDHMAFAVSDANVLEQCRRELSEAGIDCSPITDPAEPDISAAFRFSLPSGHAMELVTRPTAFGYLHYAEWDPSAVHAPLDLNHVTILAPDVRSTVDFLQKHVGFHVSDIVQPEPDLWVFTFLRVGENHHDVAVALGESEPALHHIAFLLNGFADLGRFADRLARLGYPSEVAIVRHGPGGNASLYVKDPAGNRVELTTDVARVPNPHDPPRIWEGALSAIFNVWTGEDPPATFMAGS